MSKLQYQQVKNAIEKCDGNLIEATKLLNAKYQTVYAFVKNHNILYQPLKKLTCTKEQIEEAYKRLGSLKKVAAELGGTHEGIRAAMKRYGLIVKAPVIHSCNQDFFAEDNEQSFYWAGFLAADGCVRAHSNGKEINYLSLGLAKKDKQHVELFKTHINSTAPIGDYLNKNSKINSEWNDTWRSEIKITSLKLCNDLKRFGIGPRKSLTYSFPDWLIDHPLVNHFMRGYFDGDGSFYIGGLRDGRTVKQLYFSLRGTSDFLLLYRKILERECNLEIREKPIRINNGIGVLEYGGNGILKNIGDFLYKDATLYLDRKYLLFNETIQNFK